ncbi:MAG TPA: hypothetical protein VF042_14285 [Gemmatimonadaceae bacterium]
MRDFIASQNSERLRQRLSGAVRVREPAAFARLAKSIFEIAFVTGIIARLFRMMVLTRATSPSSVAIALMFGAFFLLLMATLHISRFPIRDWLWRAPVFAVIEGAAEMVMSLVLIWLGREPLGSNAAARFSDWPGIAANTLLWRVATISIFALILAGVVKWVRYMILKKEHAAWSEGTVKAGIPGEEFIDRRHSGRKDEYDPLLFGNRRKHDKLR